MFESDRFFHPRPVERACTSFEERTGLQPTAVAFAPGRLVLLESETHLGTSALTVAIDHGIAAAGRQAEGEAIRLHSKILGETAVWSPEKDSIESAPTWARTPLALLGLLEQREVSVEPFDLIYASDLPMGWGLGSATSLASATLLFLAESQSLSLTPSECVQLVTAAASHSTSYPSRQTDARTILEGKRSRALLLNPEGSIGATAPLLETDVALVVVPSGHHNDPTSPTRSIPNGATRQALDHLSARDFLAFGRLLESCDGIERATNVDPVGLLVALARSDPDSLAAIPTSKGRNVVLFVPPGEARSVRRRVKTAYREQSDLGSGRAIVAHPGRSLRLPYPYRTETPGEV